MATLKELYQQYLDMSDSSRVNIAAKCVNTTLNYVRSCGVSEDNTIRFLVNLFKLFSSADKSTGNAEHEFFCRVTGTNVSYQDYFDATNYGSNASFVAEMDKIIDNMPTDIKNQTLVFGLCVMACDGKLTVSEQELLNRLLA